MERCRSGMFLRGCAARGLRPRCEKNDGIKVRCGRERGGGEGGGGKD